MWSIRIPFLDTCKDLFRLVLSCISRCEVFGIRVIAVVLYRLEKTDCNYDEKGVYINKDIRGTSEKATKTSYRTFCRENECI